MLLHHSGISIIPQFIHHIIRHSIHFIESILQQRYHPIFPSSIHLVVSSMRRQLSHHHSSTHHIRIHIVIQRHFRRFLGQNRPSLSFGDSPAIWIHDISPSVPSHRPAVSRRRPQNLPHILHCAR